MQRKKLTLLPRSEKPQEPLASPLSATEESKPKSNPFGAARPVDTDSVIKKVEQKLAKEKEHKEEEPARSPATSHPPASPSHSHPQRFEKGQGRGQPKQLLRRTSAQTSGNAQHKSEHKSEVDEVIAAKAEAQEESIAEGAETAWRKTDPPKVDAPTAVAPAEEDAGWETVPSRKKINGVGARH
jgi:hypothetical protein